MIQTKILYKFIYFLISFSLLLSSIVPFFLGSLYDYSFLLLSFIIWIFNLLQRQTVSRFKLYVGIYLLISTAQLISLFFANSTLFNYSLPIFLRINAFLFLLDLFLNKQTEKAINFKKNYLSLYPFILMSTICPIWAFYNSLSGFSWRIGFPLYSEGYDPHVFGPAMGCSFITLTYVLFNLDNYFEANKKPLFINLILPISIVSSISAVFFCGSRGGLLLLVGFLITYLLLFFYEGKIKLKLIPRVIKKSRLYLLGFFSLIFIVVFNFISNSSEKLGALFFRTFEILPLLLGYDLSRSNQFVEISRSLSDGLNYLLPKADIIMSEQERFNLINVDIGLAYFIYNQGFILLIVFLVIYFYAFNGLKEINKISASLLSAGLILFIFGSATLFIPRFYLIYIYSVTILAANKNLKSSLQ